MTAAALHELPSIAATTDISLMALKLVGLLETWMAEQGDAFNPKHANVYCLTSAFTSPWLGVNTLHLATKIWSWLTAVDDVMDALHVDSDDVHASADRCRRILDGDRPVASDQLAAALAEIRDELTTYPLFHQLAPLWRDTVEQLITAMQFERRASDAVAAGGAPPDLDEYLEQARESVGIMMYVVSLWSTMDEADLPDYVDQLLPPLREAALAVRLGNDLRSSAREQTSGTLNALMLGMTREQLQQAIPIHVDNCRRQLRLLVAQPLGSAVALDRLTTWCTRLYEKIDYRFPEMMEA
jgi:hypothetical protein